MCAVLTLSLAPQTVSTLSSSGGIKKEADEVLTACRGGARSWEGPPGAQIQSVMLISSAHLHTRRHIWIRQILNQASILIEIVLLLRLSPGWTLQDPSQKSFFTQAKAIVCARTPAPSPAVLLHPPPTPPPLSFFLFLSLSGCFEM